MSKTKSPQFKNFISASQVGTWIACRRRYMLEHVFRISSPAGPEAALGTIVHKCLQNLGDFKSLNEDGVLSIVKESCNTLSNREPKNDYEKGEQQMILSVLDNPSSFETINDLVLYVYRRERDALQGVEVLCNEKDFFLTIDKDGNFAKHQVPGESVGITGFIDRIDYVPDADMLVVRDYKTGQWVYSHQQADESAQGSMYILAVRKMIERGEFKSHSSITDKTKIKFVFDYVSAQCETHTSRNRGQIKTFIDYLLYMDQQRRMPAMLEKPPSRLNSFCPSCPGRNNCKKYLKACTEPIEDRAFVTDTDDIEQSVKLFDEIDARMKILKKLKDNLSGPLVEHFVMDLNNGLVGDFSVEVCKRETVSYDDNVCLELMKKHKMVEEVATFPKKAVEDVLSGETEDLDLLKRTSKKSMSSPWLRIEKATKRK